MSGCKNVSIYVNISSCLFHWSSSQSHIVMYRLACAELKGSKILLVINITRQFVMCKSTLHKLKSKLHALCLILSLSKIQPRTGSEGPGVEQKYSPTLFF